MALRAEQARLLGYESYAAYRLDDSMAKTTDAVEHLLLEVWEPAKKQGRAERGALEDVARAEGLNEPLEPWDWRYYAEKVRRAQYDLDEAEVKPYFVLDNMVAAAFDTAGRLFGLTFAARGDLPVYHPDVRVWEVRDRAGNHVGLFLHDNFARPGKHSGAWMSSYRDQQNLDGEVAPIVVNNNNFSKSDPRGRAHSVELRRRRDPVPRIRSRAARAVEPGALSLAIRHRGAARFRRVPVADLRALDVGAGRICAATPATTAPASRSPRRCWAGCSRRATSTRALLRSNTPPRR